MNRTRRTMLHIRVCKRKGRQSRSVNLFKSPHPCWYLTSSTPPRTATCLLYRCALYVDFACCYTLAVTSWNYSAVPGHFPGELFPCAIQNWIHPAKICHVTLTWGGLLSHLWVHMLFFIWCFKKVYTSMVASSVFFCFCSLCFSAFQYLPKFCFRTVY